MGQLHFHSEARKTRETGVGVAGDQFRQSQRTELEEAEGAFSQLRGPSD